VHAFTNNLHNSLQISRQSTIFAENIDRIMGTLLIHLEIWQKKENNDLEKRNQAFLIYQDENGIARVNVRFIIAVPIRLLTLSI